MRIEIANDTLTVDDAPDSRGYVSVETCSGDILIFRRHGAIELIQALRKAFSLQPDELL